MPPRHDDSEGPNKGSLKEPGIRLCPHTCDNTDNACNRTYAYARAGNACKRHAKNESKHKACTEACPAHHSHLGHRVLDREPTYSEWMAFPPEDRARYKERYIASTPQEEAKGERQDEDMDEDMDKDMDEDMDEEEDHLTLSALSKFMHTSEGAMMVSRLIFLLFSISVVT